MEARDEKRLLALPEQMASHELLLVDELGFVPLSKSVAEVAVRGFKSALRARLTLVTSNLRLQNGPRMLGSERLTAALRTGLPTTCTSWR